MMTPSPFMAIAAAEPARTPTNWPAVKSETVARLDVAAEYRALGVRFVRDFPDSKGKIQCHAIDRPDETPSAFVNVKTGVYFDGGSGEKGMHLFDFALKHGPFGRWHEAAKHYAEKVGIDLGKIEVKSRGRILEAHYDYFREDGSIAYRVNRYILPNGKKEFSQHPPDGKGSWKFGPGCMDGVRPELYRRPEILAADPGDPVFICEGEKAADAVASLGLVATTAHGGSQAADRIWPQVSGLIAGRDCFILPDNDRPGKVAAAKVANHLLGIARAVKVIELPDLPPKGDAFEWIGEGGTAEELCRLAHSAPAWNPSVQDSQGTSQKSQKSQNDGSRSTSETFETFETHSEESEWKRPRLYGPSPAVPFPIHVLPPLMADHIRTIAERMGCPADFPALAALAVASGVIGRSVVLILRNGWEEQAVFYFAMIGDPGMAKSPAISAIARPLFKITGELLDDHKRALNRWKSNREGDGDEPAPVLRRMLIDDATVESIVPILQDNPRGLVMVRDELSALFSGMGQYKSGGKGSDRQFFLSAWSGSAISVDRKGNADKIPIYVARPFLSIVGGLTPDMLSEMGEAKGRNDGFVDRLLFTAPSPVSVRWREDGVPPEMDREWENVVRALWEAAPDADPEGNPRPHFVRFTPAARAMWGKWHDTHMAEAEGEDFPDYLKGPWSKMRSYCARIALVLDRLGRAYDPTWDGSASDVDAESLALAIELMAFFKANTERVHSMIHGHSGDNPDARAILRWINSTGRSRFSEREARQNFRKRFPAFGPQLEETLRWLIGRNCIRPADPDGKPHTGRAHSQEYEVNPAILHSASFDRSPQDLAG